MEKETKSKIGPKEQGLRDLREARISRAKSLIDKTFKPKAGKAAERISKGKKVVVQFKQKRGRTGR